MPKDRDRVREAVERVVRRHRDDPRVDLGGTLRLFPGYEDLVREVWAACGRDEVTAARASAGDEPSVTPGPTGAEISPAPSDATPAGGRRIGAYRIVREIGRGGMGVVLLAEDERLGRRVALKVIAPGFAESAEARGRFRREAEAAARLDHPAICTVYETGEHDGMPFLAMRFVEGRTLAAHLADARAAGLPPGHLGLPGTRPASASGAAQRSSASAGHRAELAATLLLVEKVARALHVAHAAGVVHRDVKPANVMVRPDGEPVVLDFGLARPETLADTGLTAPGSLVGTPAYLPPENLLGRGGPADRRSDVYSLGVVLHECVAGELPFAAPTLDALYQQIMTTEPPDVRRRCPAASLDLSVVIRTAMEKDRARRYQSALDLAEDLRRVREHEPILARPAGPATRLRRWAQRRPALSAALGLAAASLVAGLATTLVLWRRAEGFRTTAESAAQDLRGKNAALVAAERAAQAARDVARAEALVAASEAEAAGAPALALLLAATAADVPGALERPAVLRRLAAATHVVTERALLRRPGLAVTTTAFAPTDDRFAVGYADGEVRLHGRGGEERLRLGAHRDVVTSARFFPAGDRLLTTSWDGTAAVWGPDGAEIARLAPAGGGRVLCGAVASDGSFVATGHEDGAARLWSPTGALLAEARGHDGWVSHLRLSPDGARLATAASDRAVRLFARDGAPLGEHRAHALWIGDAEFLADGRVVTVCRGGTVAVWDGARAPATASTGRACFDVAVSGVRLAVGTEEGVRVLDVAGDELRAVAAVDGERTVRRVQFLPGDGGLLVGDASGAVRRWTPGGGPSLPLCAHGDAVSDLAVSPDGTVLVSAGADETARVTDLRGPGRAVVGGAGGRVVYSASCSPARDEFVSGHADGTARIHGFDGDERAVLRGHEAAVVCVRWSPDGERIATGSADRTARVWSRDGRLLATLAGHSGTVVRVRWSPDGTRLLTCGDDPSHPPRPEGTAFPRGWSDVPGGRGARTWTSDGRELARFADDQLVNAAEFLPDGRRAVLDTAVVSDDGTVLATLPDHEGRTAAVAVSPDGSRIATSGPNLKVRICDPSGRVLREVAGDWNIVGALAWSPDGRHLVATGPDSSRASVWDEDGGLVVELGPFGSHVVGAEYSRDGRRIAVASWDGTASVWSPSGELLAVLRGHDAPVVAARFSRDGRTLLTLGVDGTARTWDLDAGALRALAARRTVRGFLPAERVRYAEILGLDPAAERDAKRRADAVLARLPLPEDAAAQVRADTTLDDALRARVLAILAESRIDAQRLAALAWFDVRYAGAGDDVARRALRSVDAARRVAPTSLWRGPLYRGVALFRLGRLEEAAAELRRNVTISEALGETNTQRERLFLVQIARRLGDAAEEERHLAHLRRDVAEGGTVLDEGDPQLEDFERDTGITFPPPGAAR